MSLYQELAWKIKVLTNQIREIKMDEMSLEEIGFLRVDCKEIPSTLKSLHYEQAFFSKFSEGRKKYDTPGIAVLQVCADKKNITEEDDYNG